jgi:hypothetical protein
MLGKCRAAERMASNALLFHFECLRSGMSIIIFEGSAFITTFATF